jgi:hypothetical protein
MKKKRGGVRPGAGKKMLIGVKSKRVNIAIDSESAEHLRKLGGGNLSFGIRIASARVEGMDAWKSFQVQVEVVQSWSDRAKALATERGDQYVAMEHLLCTVDKFESPFDLIIFPACKAKSEMLKYMIEIMNNELISRSNESKLRVSKSFLEVVNDLNSGLGLMPSIVRQGSDSIAYRSLKKFGFLL